MGMYFVIDTLQNKHLFRDIIVFILEIINICTLLKYCQQRCQVSCLGKEISLFASVMPFVLLIPRFE